MFSKRLRFALLGVIYASITGAVATSSGSVSYDGYKVLRVKTGRQLNDVQKALSNIQFEKWNHDIAHHIDILLPPNQLEAFASLNLDSHTMHHDLGDSIKAESAPSSAWKRQSKEPNWWDSYHSYEEHVQYFEDLQARFPNNSEIISSGTSYEGRDIYGLHLWGGEGPGKPAVLYHGTVHAREISAPVVEYITTQLVEGYSSGENLTTILLNKYDFFIFPFVNPDGFVYSQTTERLWRKNRQPGPRNSTCFGRDINRNWEFGWDANPLGASTNPCSQVYRGEAPSDTPENQGLDKLVRKLRKGPGIKLFIDWHSYGQYLLFPYGYNETLYAPELGKWTKAASMVSAEIRDSSPARTTFTFGPSGATLYTTTGAAPGKKPWDQIDHVYAIGGAEFSFTIELRDTGDFGFILPPDQIRGTVEEQWAGQRLLLNFLDETFFDGEGPAIYFE